MLLQLDEMGDTDDMPGRPRYLRKHSALADQRGHDLTGTPVSAPAMAASAPSSQYDSAVAAIWTAIALLLGGALGYFKGGNIRNLLLWRPALGWLLVAGLTLQLIVRSGNISSGWAVVIECQSAALLLKFVWANRRQGGMVLILVGLVMNLIPTVVHQGLPVSRQAAEAAGVVSSGQAVQLRGARHFSSTNEPLRFLGEHIVLPPGQVVSPGDIILLAGYGFTLAAILRKRRLRRGSALTYNKRIAPLGHGPAERRGPGLHPSRMGRFSHPASGNDLSELP